MDKDFKFEVPVSISEKTSDKIAFTKVIVHLITFGLNVLILCIIAPLIAIEARYLGAGQAGPNYACFVAIFSFPVALLLVYFPWMYEKKNKFKRLGKFCLKNRTNLILCGFHSFLWATAGIATTVHANNSSTCQLSEELFELYGSDYSGAWATQCNLGKTAAAFSWIICILWVTTLIITFFSFWKEKQQIQKRLKEHKANKESSRIEINNDYATEERQGYYQEDVLHHNPSSRVPTSDMGTYNSSNKHYYDDRQNQPMMQESHTAYEEYRPTSYSGPPMGQYPSNSPPTAFSPMPVPQHASYPNQPYYNNN